MITGQIEVNRNSEINPLNTSISAREQLKGSLTGEENLNGKIDSEAPLKGKLNISNSGTRDYEKLRNKPQINGVELIGNKSLEDLGIEADKNFYFVQNEALDTWVIVHNLNKYPSVSVIDSSGSEVIGEVSYDSVNQITITFKGAFKGKATLN